MQSRLYSLFYLKDYKGRHEPLHSFFIRKNASGPPSRTLRRTDKQVHKQIDICTQKMHAHTKETLHTSPQAFMCIIVSERWCQHPPAPRTHVCNTKLETDRQTGTQTDRQTDRQTDGQTASP